MEFDEAIASRRSVRSFKKKKASWKDILEAIDAATKAPFAGNLNHLKFLIIEDISTIEKIAEQAHQPWITESGILIVVCSDDYYIESEYGERGRIYARQQAGAAIENLLLKIVDLGLSACWVGAYSDEIVKHILNIPQHIQVEAIIPVGYESGKTPKKPKRSLESVIYWETWEKTNRPTLSEEPPIDNYK
jgi:nitroreductase